MLELKNIKTGNMSPNDGFNSRLEMQNRGLVNE